MVFVIVGLVLIVLNLVGIGPVGNWSWTLSGDLWKFACPFALAVLWWTWADFSGLTKRREIKAMEATRRARRRKHLAGMGLDSTLRRKDERP